MIYYKISNWNFSIEEVDVTRVTEHSVFFRSQNGKEIRNSKDLYFHSKEAAKQKIIDREQADLKRAELALENAKKELEKAKAIVI